MALNVYIFEKRRKNEPFTHISLRIRAVIRASVSHLKNQVGGMVFLLTHGSCILAPVDSSRYSHKNPKMNMSSKVYFGNKVSLY